ncbi:Tat pathway signal sequence domain protein [Pseudomonas syringae group sp. J309-1]|uniref:exo-rhamnogalacturonan lyase family protein n=1 Tax=Pseudomonas syringae group sp. J309-1 TaxID=3079588 RepID=UPI0029109DB5|nr:Tat pathway signal sequence domain protein [Pseudomonas syringae group sp. J309-1]MDU8357485.1 Tat pathway signal sequence domain protein [Pseudomonas syringae group sp. J309-1]
MTEFKLDRRSFLRASVVTAGAVPFIGNAAGATSKKTADAGLESPLGWLGNTVPKSFAGVTWGTPWPWGQVAAGSQFQIYGSDGSTPTLQSWPLAYWPDGSLKWTAHAIAPQAQPVAEHYDLRPTQTSTADNASLVQESADAIRVDTGLLQCVIPRQGASLIQSVTQKARSALLNGHLLLQVQGDPDQPAEPLRQYRSEVQRVVVEQQGPVRAVLALHGTHRDQNGTATLLPFTVRLYFYAGSDVIRVIHTLVLDIDERKDFITGVGLRFDSPLHAELHDRHVRFISADGGVFAEAVRGLTGLRRNPGDEIMRAQIEGRSTGPVTGFAPEVANRLQYIPAFGSYRLLQAHPDGFQISKRTASGQSWLHSATGQRAAGLGYLGSPDGGVVFGLRNFWQSFPAQLDIEAAHSEQAQVTVWLWAPQAAPMDLRSYHDGLGEDSFVKQREALEITYEDYEPGFNTPSGIARTSELELQFVAATPSAVELQNIAQRIQQPPLLAATPERMHAAGVFGPDWAPPGKSTGRKQQIEQQLAWYFDFYRDEVEQRKWYGFWDYGDVMHTYDEQRHVWRYDVGGFAWDNSELSTDLWLWYYFLRTGRQDVFRMAEAMTRHTGEVDVHHIGRFAPLGSRHNVQHWGDSAKQLRISTAANRRFLYYLTADERVGDLLNEQVEALRTLREVVPGRKIGQQADPREGYASITFGTDWGAIAAAWLTDWERSGDPAVARRLLNSMETIAAQPHGFFTGVANMHLDSGRFDPDQSGKLSVSHLSAVFGLAEICSELLQLLPSASFERAWLDYCRLYNAPVTEHEKALGEPLANLNLKQGHARLTAFAAWRLQDKALHERAWKEFFAGSGGIPQPNRRLHRIEPPAYLYALNEPDPVSVIDEHSGTSSAANLSTNAVAQWGLTAIALLALDNEPR